MANGVELGNAYISINARTDAMAGQIKAALNGSAKVADQAGADLGARLSKSASKAMRDGWRPDQDIMAGIPNTKLDMVGARIGQLIGKGVASGMKAREAGSQFARSFADGAGSIGIGRIIAGWRSELTGGGALAAMGSLAGKTFSAALTGAIGIGVAGAGLSLAKGFERLLTIDTSKTKLKSLGKSTQEIADIVKTVTDSVTGTPFSLDEAFATAVQAIGTGSKDIGRFMKDVTDAAGFAGVGLDRMGLIFTQVLAKGKLQGDEMMQLMEAGLPAKSWIEDSYHLTSDQFDKMQAKGQITMEMLQKSIEDHAGGMAKAAGDSLQGAIGNMQTAIARVGADFLSAVFGGPSGDPTEGMKDAVKRFADMLNNLDAWIKAHRDDIRTFFVSAADAAKGLADALGKILGYLKEHPGAIQAVVTAFAAWQGIKFTGLLAALGDKGGGGVLGKLGLILAAIDVIGRFTGSSATGPVSAGPNFGQQALDAGTGMLIGGQLAGVPGAIAGGLIGGSVAPVTDAIKGGLPAQNGVLPGAPNTANVPTVGGIPIPGLLPGNGSNKFAPSGNAQGGAESWRPAVRATLSAYGPQYGITNSQAWEDAMIRQIATESGGNPNAINNWDSNAAAGHPSQGLLQFIPSTFAAHNITGGGFTDPMAQMAAFIPYVMQRYGVDKSGAPLHVGRGVGYDSGGWLQPGNTLVQNNTGKPEAVFTHDQMQDMRTAGYLPAAAGNMGKAGDSTVAKAIGMGAEVINGLIDQAASAASTAVSAGIAGGTMGAGALGGSQAGAAAAQFAIGLGTNAAKRGVTWGGDMLGIGADAILQQVMPFGMPRWLSTDPGAFMPNMDITGALGNLMSQGAAPAAEGQRHGTTNGAPPGISNLMDSTQPSPAGWFGDSLRHGDSQGAPPGPDAGWQDSMNSLLSTELAQQPAAASGQPTVKIDTVYAQDPTELSAQIAKRQQLAAMQYTGRPGP